MQLRCGEELNGYALVDREGNVSLSEICPTLASAESLKSAAEAHQPHRGPLKVMGISIMAYATGGFVEANEVVYGIQP